MVMGAPKFKGTPDLGATTWELGPKLEHYFPPPLFGPNILLGEDRGIAYATG